jgi:protein-S-isoprenylcysteine O-methyltransferase Ste14
MNPMNGLDLTMLADAGFLISPVEMPLLAVILLGPVVLAIVGLAFAWRRRRSRAILMVVISVGTAPVFALSMGGGEAMDGVLASIFLEWDPTERGPEAGLVYLLKLPFILGIVTLAWLYYQHRKETKERQLREEIECYVQK